MSKFEYPTLPRKEIIAILAESQIASVSESDIIHPNPDSVADLYTKLLLYLDSLQEDDGQVEFAALEQLENPDQHVESIRAMNLYNKIKEMVSAVHCPISFKLRDLLRPDGDRTEFFISSILNYCLHKDSKMDKMRPIVEELSLLDEQGQEFEARISEVNSEIEECNEARERETPFIQELDAKVKELRQTIPNLNNHQMSLRTSFRKMKEKAVEMDEKISSAEFVLVQSLQENASLRDKIVQSPDKLQKALEEKKLVQVEAKNAERLAMQSFHDKYAILEVHTKASKKMSKHFAQMQAIQEQLNNAKLIEKDVKVLKTKLGDEGVLDKSLEAKLVGKQGKAEHLDESRKQLERERDSKCEEAAKELNHVKLEVESRKHDLETRQKNVEAVVLEVDTLTSKINTIKESAASKRQELLFKGEKLVKEFYQHSSSLGAMLPKLAG